jgi:transposase
LEFPQKNTQATLEDYIVAVEEAGQSVRRLEQAIHETAEDSLHARMTKALQGFRGIKEVAAATIVADVGDFTRFPSAESLMSYAGSHQRSSRTWQSGWKG